MIFRERRKTRLAGITFAVFVMICAGGGYSVIHDDAPIPAKILDRPSSLADGMSLDRETTVSAAAPRSAEATQASVPPAATKQQQYDALKKGDTAQRFDAYKLVRDCLEPDAIWRFNQAIGRTLPMPDLVENCGDLNPGTLGNDAERRALLIPAVKAGRQGAYSALLGMEGPDGAIAMTMPGHIGMAETEWRALLAEGIAAGLKTADPVVADATAFRVTQLTPAATQEQQALALEVLVAGWTRRWESLDRKPDLAESLAEAPVAQRLLKALPADVAGKAIEAGKAPRPKEVQP